MACGNTKLDSTERLELEDMARRDDTMVAIRRVTLDDLLHDLGFWEERITKLGEENERLRAFVVSQVCTGHREVPLMRSCEFGHRICLEARAALAPKETT